MTLSCSSKCCLRLTQHTRVSSKEAYATHIVDLKEQINLLHDCLFGGKTEQAVDLNTPQLAMFSEAESEPLLTVEAPD